MPGRDAFRGDTRLVMLLDDTCCELHVQCPAAPSHLHLATAKQQRPRCKCHVDCECAHHQEARTELEQLDPGNGRHPCPAPNQVRRPPQLGRTGRVRNDAAARRQPRNLAAAAISTTFQLQLRPTDIRVYDRVLRKTAASRKSEIVCERVRKRGSKTEQTWRTEGTMLLLMWTRRYVLPVGLLGKDERLWGV